MTDITKAQFANFPNVAGRTTFSYAQLLAQLTKDLPSGSSSVGLGVEVTNNGAQTFTDGSLGFCDFNVSGGGGNVSYDDANFYSDANSTVLTIPNVTPAIQRVRAFFLIRWAANMVGDRFMRTSTNQGAAFPGHIFDSRLPTSAVIDSEFCAVSDAIPVVVGDEIDFRALQRSGGNLQAIIFRAGLTVVK